MKRIPNLIIILLMFILVVLFQNCHLDGNSPKVLLQSIQFASQSDSSGNGSGYEGKPEIFYYRYVPSFECKNNLVPLQIASISDDSVKIFSNSADQCGKKTEYTTISEVGFSPFQKDFVIIKNRLFKKYNEMPIGIPDQIAEILCRDNFQNPNYEIISHFDNKQKKALSHIYLQDEIISDFNVSRLLNMNNVSYVSDRIKFTVDFNLKDENGNHIGELTKSSISGIKPIKLSCVIGGALDTSFWQIQELIPLNTIDFILDKTGDAYLISDINGLNKFHLFKQTLSQSFEQRATKINNMSEESNLSSFFTDIFKEVMGADLTTTIGINLFHDKFLRLTINDPAANLPPNTSNSYLVDTQKYDKTWMAPMNIADEVQVDFMNNHYVHSREGNLFYDHTDSIDVYDSNLKFVNKIYSINDTLNFKVLKESNKIVIAPHLKETNFQSQLLIYDIKSKLISPINLNFPDKCRMYVTFMEVVNNEQSIITQSVCDYGYAEFTQLFLISLVDGKIQSLGRNKFINWIDKSRNWIVVDDIRKKPTVINEYENFASASLKKMINVNNNAQFNVEVDSCKAHFGYTDLNHANSSIQFEYINNCPWKLAIKEDKYFYGISGTASLPFAVRYNVFTGEKTKLCNNVKGEVRYFLNNPSADQIYLMTYDSKLNSYNIFNIDNNDGSCASINQFPSRIGGRGSPQSIQVTPIGFVIHFQDLSATISELIFIPIDGRPPIQVNQFIDRSYKMKVNSELNRLYFLIPNIDQKVTEKNQRLYYMDLTH